jgi:hypothetical protein
MGTWGSGPFANDAALDFVADVVKPLEDTVKGFVEHPEIDGDFDFALAAIALLNAIYGTCNAHRPEPAVARAWQLAFLGCFDEQIDSLQPKGSYKAEKRQTIVKELGRFVAACEDFHRA